jgi:hypothetical protein
MKVAGAPDTTFTYASLAKTLFMSASEIHASLARARIARLATPNDGGPISVIRKSLRDLLLHGAQFAFPAVTGPMTRGFPTAHASPALRDLFVQSDEPPPVWPFAKGGVRGIALYPLYPTVPRAAEIDSRLYESLALFDALRIGRSRERDSAAEALNKLLL